MCSINGVFSLKGRPLPASFLQEHRKIAEDLDYRGPDRTGQFHDSAAALFANQLDITDPGSTFQPVANEERTFFCVLAGQIYNYKEINKDLEKKGWVFSTGGDVETLLRSYEEYGADCFSRFEGMFALAIYDKRKNSLLLARDRFGEKPLYFIARNGFFHFCSESNFLIPFSSRKVSSQSLSDYFSFGFSFEPMMTGLKRLRPGQYLTAGNGDWKTTVYWKPVFRTNNRCSADEACEEGLGILRRETAKMLPDKVKFGAYISGGVDSALVSKLIEMETGNVDLLTSGLVGLAPRTEALPLDEDYAFVEKAVNEFSFSDTLFSNIKGEHSKIQFTVSDVIKDLSNMVRHLPCGPVVSTSFPLFYFTALNSGRYRVCLVGEGSDEIHGGYRTSQPENYDENIPSSYCRLSDYFSQDEVTSLLGSRAKDYFANTCRIISDDISRNFEHEGPEEDRDFNRIRYFMVQHVFGRLLLEKGEGMAMGMGPTELRAPYLSKNYSDFVFRLPLSLCRLGGRRKGLIYKMAGKVGAPDEIVRRTQKQRTSLPYYNLVFFDPQFRSFASSLLGKESLLGDHLKMPDPWAFICGLKGARNAHKRAWAFIILELWLRNIGGDRVLGS